MQAELISVGTELLLGDIVNTNAQYLAQQLAALGITVYYQTVVGDNPQRLQQVAQQAKNRSDILLFTGGLGPTDDDLTKQTIAQVFNDTLQEDAAVVADLKRFFASLNREMTENNLKQAMLPVNGGKLRNPNGTAPGVFFKDGEKMAFLMPGPPSEMRPMYENEIKPILQKMQTGVLCSHTLHVFGIGESDLETRIHSFLDAANPTTALYAKTGEVHIRITAKADSKAQGDAMCAEVEKQLTAILGDTIYSTHGENLETVAVNLLHQNNQTLATAESCTGGLLSERITTVPGASAVFGFGMCTYANEAKKALLGVQAQTLAEFGAVSSQTAAEMALGARAVAGASFGVGITGIAGPDGGTSEKPVGLVYVAACNGETVYVKRLTIAKRSREYVRFLATENALDMVRRLALELPQPGTQSFAAGQRADFIIA